MRDAAVVARDGGLGQVVGRVAWVAVVELEEVGVVVLLVDTEVKGVAMGLLVVVMRLAVLVGTSQCK